MQTSATIYYSTEAFSSGFYILQNVIALGE